MDNYKEFPNDDLFTAAFIARDIYKLKAAEQMKTEGDFVSRMTDAKPLSCYAEV